MFIRWLFPVSGLIGSREIDLNIANDKIITNYEGWLKMASRTFRVAVMCWFPTNSEPIPMSLKYQDQNGEIHTLKDIRIKNTNTISQGKRFVCQSAINDTIVNFELMFFADDCHWIMTI